MLLAVLGALAIGLSLGLLGSGGSILTVPVLHYLLDQPEQAAIGGSLLVVGLIAASATVPYAMARQVDWRKALWFGFPGMAGAWLGASLARWVPGPVQLALFAAVMLIAAWRMLGSAPLLAEASEPHPFAVVASGAAVGMKAMVMPFQVAAAVPLDGLAPGDKIRFRFVMDWASSSSAIESIERLPADTALDYGAR